MPITSQFCTFFLDQLCFGIEVEKVQEILRQEGMTPVPLSPPEIGGLINLRGQIVTTINLRKRLELPSRINKTPPLNVVVTSNDEIVSLLVDEVGDVLDISEEQFEQAPDTLTGKIRTLIRGTYKLEDRLLLVLNIDEVTNVTCVV